MFQLPLAPSCLWWDCLSPHHPSDRMRAYYVPLFVLDIFVLCKQVCEPSRWVCLERYSGFGKATEHAQAYLFDPELVPLSDTFPAESVPSLLVRWPCCLESFICLFFSPRSHLRVSAVFPLDTGILWQGLCWFRYGGPTFFKQASSGLWAENYPSGLAWSCFESQAESVPSSLNSWSLLSSCCESFDLFCTAERSSRVDQRPVQTG